MDLLAPILAYFGTVAAIVLAVAMSYNVLVYKPLHTTGPQGAITVAAKPNAAKPSSTAKPGIAASHSPAAQPVVHDVAAAKAAPHPIAAEHRSLQAANTTARWQHMRQARAKPGAYPW